MKNVKKKAGFLSLAVLVGLSSTFVINEISSRQLNTTNTANTTNSYVLNRHFIERNFESPSQNPNRQNLVIPSQNESSQNLANSQQDQNSQGFVTPSQNSDPQDTVTSSQDSNSQNNGTAVNLPTNTQASSNWGGYIVTPASNKGYTSVSGSWKVPNITTNNSDGAAAQWIGLGGVNSSDLLQMGTIEQIENGQPTAEVFWEQLPDAAQNILSVPIGSTINAKIYKMSGSDWNLTFTVTTPNNQTQSKTITTALDSSYAQGISTSAEWISEDPTGGNGQLIPLASTDRVNFKSAAVNGQPINTSGNAIQPVAMVSDYGTIAISPSTLGTDGESFTTRSTNTASGYSSYSVQGYYGRHSRTRFGRNR